jgi:hypothetical protein
MAKKIPVIRLTVQSGHPYRKIGAGTFILTRALCELSGENFGFAVSASLTRRVRASHACFAPRLNNKMRSFTSQS